MPTTNFRSFVGMSHHASTSTPFLIQLRGVIESELSNEDLGVSELAGKVGMSRSNLLRRIKRETGLSASVFIRQVRLQNAMKLLLEGQLNVSEVSYKVGFASTSYFIKCFREHYGYPPGEAGKRQHETPTALPSRSGFAPILIVGLFSLTMLLVALSVFFSKPVGDVPTEKSIAVLPIRNNSNDSTNVYFINGVMEAILGNLQKIEDLRVISRTSAEQYREPTLTIPEIGQALRVSYLVEGSGQKVGDEILLNIQLLQAATDRPIWSNQYRRKIVDVFQLQSEIARHIADNIQAVITTEEIRRINQPPTDNLAAYDHYLKGLELLTDGNLADVGASVPWFEKAIDEDPDFASAYALCAIALYYQDIYQSEKKYLLKISDYADKALLHDPKLPEGLMAKAMFYLNNDEPAMAVTYLEKALEYNPNFIEAINMLSDLYARYLPNTSKYIAYALRGVQLDIPATDSTTISYTYLHLSNALIQSGFVDEALYYVDRSLAFDPNNGYSAYVKAFMLYAKNGDLEQTRRLLLKEFEKDTTRLDILQDLAKVTYYQQDFESAYRYYDQFHSLRMAWNLDIYAHENIRIAQVFRLMNREEEADRLAEDYLKVALADESMYRPLLISGYYSYKGDDQKALEYLAQFTNQEDFQYWIVLFWANDPLVGELSQTKRFQEIQKTVESKFWNNHAKIRESLLREGLLPIPDVPAIRAR